LQQELLEQTVEFKFHAPQAETVNVAGTFNGWNTQLFSLKKLKDGSWKGALKLKPGRYEYRFFVEGRWENAPGTACVPNSFGSTNCVLEVK